MHLGTKLFVFFHHLLQESLLKWFERTEKKKQYNLLYYHLFVYGNIIPSFT